MAIEGFSPNFLKRLSLFLIIPFFAAIITFALPSISESGDFRSPIRLTFGGGSNLLVSDYLGNSIVIVNSDTLRPKSTITVAGRPLGIAWAGGKFIVGNETTATVEVYGRSGRLLYNLGEAGQVRQPSDMDVDPTMDRVFVIDAYDRDVKIFDLAGPFIGTMGDGILSNPTGLAVDAGQGRVYVSDYGDLYASYPAKIVVFDYSGNSILEISGGTGGFSRPQGIGLDDSGHLYLVDAFIGKVLIFDAATGDKLGTLGEFGSGPGQLQLPLDAVYDGAASALFVTNNRPGRIEVFQTGGVSP